MRHIFLCLKTPLHNTNTGLFLFDKTNNKVVPGFFLQTFVIPPLPFGVPVSPFDTLRYPSRIYYVQNLTSRLRRLIKRAALYQVALKAFVSAFYVKLHRYQSPQRWTAPVIAPPNMPAAFPYSGSLRFDQSPFKMFAFKTVALGS